MRVLAALCVFALLSPSASAQQPAARNPPPDLTRAAYVSAADLAAMVARQPADRNGTLNRLLQFPPYAVNIEHRVAVPQTASVHETEAELFYVIDGGGTIVTGGKLVKENRTNAENLTGSGIEGGTSRKLGKGDFVLVTEGVPHWFSAIDGELTMMSLHLPRAGAGK